VRTFHLILLGAAAAAPASAQSVQFSAVAQSEMGYATNPFVTPGRTDGSIFASASIAPRFVYQTARSSTTVQSRYSRETYLKNFGYTDSGMIGLIRTDQLTQYLGSVLTANFQTSNRETIGDPNQITTDPLNIGRRTRTLTGSYQLQWQASARDQLNYGTQVSHLSYGGGQASGPGGVPSAYTQYGVNAGYNHTVDARTTIGAQVTLSTVRSKIYPDSRTIQPALTGKRQLSAVWAVDGHIGMSFSRIEGPFPETKASLGVGFNLCGTYPRTNICLRLNRDTQPSGFGPLRTTTSIGGDLTHQLDEHSRIRLSGQFFRNSSGSFSTIGVPVARDSKVILTSTDYDRDVTQRVSAGIGGRFQWRELTGYSTARSYTATFHVKAKLGRM